MDPATLLDTLSTLLRLPREQHKRGLDEGTMLTALVRGRQRSGPGAA